MHRINNTTMYIHDVCRDPNWEVVIFSLPQSPSAEGGEESQEKEGLNLFKVILSMPPLLLLSCIQLSILAFWKSVGNMLALSSLIVMMCSLPMKTWHSEKQKNTQILYTAWLHNNSLWLHPFFWLVFRAQIHVSGHKLSSHPSPSCSFSLCRTFFLTFLTM